MLTASSAHGVTAEFVDPGTYTFSFPPYAFGPLDNTAPNVFVHVFHGMDGVFGAFQTLGANLSYDEHSVTATMYPLTEPGLYTFFILYSSAT